MDYQDGLSSAIGVQFNVDLDDSIVNDLKSELAKLSNDIRTLPSDNSRAYMSWEWTVAAGVAIYVGLELTNGFLRELGAGVARGMKTTLATVYGKAKNKNARLMTLSESKAAVKEIELAETEQREPDRAVLDALGKPVPVLSVFLATDARTKAKFVFPYELDDGALDHALSTLPMSVASMLSKKEETAVGAAGSNDPFGPGDVYVYRSERAEWIDAKAELKAQLDATRQRKD